MTFNKQWFSEFESGLSFISVGEYFNGKPGTVKITDLLRFEEKDLKEFGIGLISDEAPEYTKKQIKTITSGVRAFLQFQDILDFGFVEPNISGEQMINRHYCYYESIAYLKESIASLLDKNLLASITLLRPFLELAITHIYWRIRGEKQGLKRYFEWVNDPNSHKESFSKMLDYIFNNLSSKSKLGEKRTQQLKAIIKNIFKALCAYNHTPKIDESFTVKSGDSKISYEVLARILITYELLLNQIVYLYILSYPMSLFPVEKVNKWGFSGPVGVFFDECNYSILQEYIGESNLNKLKEALSTLDEVMSHLDWYNSLPSLTDEEIENDWFAHLAKSKIDFDANDLSSKMAFLKAQLRSLRLATSFINLNKRKAIDVSDDILEKQYNRALDW